MPGDKCRLRPTPRLPTPPHPPDSADGRAGTYRRGRPLLSVGIEPGPPRWAPPSRPFPVGAEPPGPAPAAPGACSSSSRAGAPCLGSPCGRQTLRLGAPKTLALLSVGPQWPARSRMRLGSAERRPGRHGDARRRPSLDLGRPRSCGKRRKQLLGSTWQRSSSRGPAHLRRAGSWPESPGSRHSL